MQGCLFRSQIQQKSQISEGDSTIIFKILVHLKCPLTSSKARVVAKPNPKNFVLLYWLLQSKAKILLKFFYLVGTRKLEVIETITW